MEKEAPWRCQMTHGTRSLARQKRRFARTQQAVTLELLLCTTPKSEPLLAGDTACHHVFL
jgi:hypothetical protein